MNEDDSGNSCDAFINPADPVTPRDADGKDTAMGDQVPPPVVPGVGADRSGSSAGERDSPETVVVGGAAAHPRR